MREASLILPAVDHACAHETDKAQLERCLLDHFGGFTVAPVRGVWVGDNATRYDDDGFEYRIAARWDAEKDAALFKIAAKIALALDQECVYVRRFNGDVHFVTRTGDDYGT